MSGELRERVARAIAGAGGGLESAWRRWLEEADAVLAELAAELAPQATAFPLAEIKAVLDAEPGQWMRLTAKLRRKEGEGYEVDELLMRRTAAPAEQPAAYHWDGVNPPVPIAPQPQAEPVAWQTRYRMFNGQWSDWQTRMNHDDAKSNLKFYASRNTEAQVRGLYPIPGADND